MSGIKVPTELRHRLRFVAKAKGVSVAALVRTVLSRAVNKEIETMSQPRSPSR